MKTNRPHRSPFSHSIVSIILLGGAIVFWASAKSFGIDEVNTPAIHAEGIRAARSGLALITRAATNWQKNQTCFSCHHQTLIMLAAIEANQVGLPLEPEWLKSQLKTTHQYFERRIEAMDAGDHVPGGAATVGYGLWAMALSDAPADATTTAMVGYLLQIQGVVKTSDRVAGSAAKVSDGRWVASCRRAPLQGSDIADTVLALVGMEKYATAAQRPRLAKARHAADKWMETVSLNHQQDRLWRLWGLHHLDGTEKEKQRVREAIFAAQREDGGWAETKDRQSDAYSTGQTLYMLNVTGTAQTDPQLLRARDYLLRSQLPDGSWLFETHVKPQQPFFENGDPHGKSQFISTAATAWATAGLSRMGREK